METGNKNNQEQHPLFPSGDWEGFYTYDLFNGSKDQMDIHLDFSNGKVSGGGSDNVGAFAWEGIYETEKGICNMTKNYFGKHQVFYRGHVDENGIWGKWHIQANWSGGFHIWPKKNGNKNQKEAIKVKSKPLKIKAITK